MNYSFVLEVEICIITMYWGCNDYAYYTRGEITMYYICLVGVQ